MQHTRCTLLPVVMHIVLLAATWFSTCASAYADSSAPTFSLNWVRHAGAEQCASSQHLARAIEQLLGPILRSPAEAELSIEGTIAQPAPGVFEMQMRVLSPQGELVGARSFRRKAVECSALTPAIVLVLTLTLDPNAAAHGFPTEQLARISSPEDPATTLLSELNAQPPTPVAVAPSPPRVPAQRAAPPINDQTVSSAPPRWHGALQLGPSVAFALLPRVAGGVGLGSELVSPWRASLLLGLSYWARAAATVHSLDLSKSVRFSAVQAQLSGIRELVDVRLYEPYFLDSKFSASIDVYKQRRIYTDFAQDSLGGSLTFGYPLIEPELTASVAYTAEKTSVSTQAT